MDNPVKTLSTTSIAQNYLHQCSARSVDLAGVALAVAFFVDVALRVCVLVVVRLRVGDFVAVIVAAADFVAVGVRVGVLLGVDAGKLAVARRLQSFCPVHSSFTVHCGQYDGTHAVQDRSSSLYASSVIFCHAIVKFDIQRLAPGSS